MMRLLGFLTICLLVISRSAMSTAPSCATVDLQLAPCATYIEGRVMAAPSSGCCTGVKNIFSQVKTRADRVATCNCIKAALSKLGQYVPSRISDLPKKCGVSINLPPIDSHYDCSKVSPLVRRAWSDLLAK